MRRVVFNRKGGVGKTSIVCNLAAAAAQSGLSTLVVDLDPQANATSYLLGRDAAVAEPTLFDFFQETLSFRLFDSEPDRFVHDTGLPSLSILTASPDLAELHSKLEARHKIYKLREALDALDGYRWVLIDTPPAINFFTLSALIAADRCLIPFDCDEFSRRALYQLLGTVREIQKDHNPGLVIEGIVVNQFQSRAKLPKRIVQELAAEGLPLLEPFLGSSVKMRESHQASRPLVQMAPRHKLTGQYLELFRALS